jgi:hypothetical protein
MKEFHKGCAIEKHVLVNELISGDSNIYPKYLKEIQEYIESSSFL